MAEQTKPNQVELTTLHLMSEGGSQYQPVDSMAGGVWRDQLAGAQGGRLATLETMWDFWINNVVDPDEAMARDPDILTRMYMHPDVSAAMNKRSFTVASYPEKVEPNKAAKNPELAKLVADYVNSCWERLPNRLHLYQEMQTAVLEGGTAFEFIWKKEVDGTERPVNFFQIHKTRIVFDRMGNMAIRTRRTPVWGSYVSAAMQGGQENVERFLLGKFIYHQHKRAPGRWAQPGLEGYQYFGLGEDVALYYPITFDIFIMRQRMRFLEKYGDPPIDIYGPDNGPGVTKDGIARVAASVRGESVCFFPRPVGTGKEHDFWLLKQRDVPAMSNDAFERFQQGYTTRKVDKILLGSAEESERSDAGSYSGDVVRHQGGPEVLYLFDATNIGNTISQQVFPAIAMSKWPGLPPEYWPILKLSPKEERDRNLEAEIIEQAVTLVPVPEAEIYDRLGIRKPINDEPTVFSNPQAPTDPFDVPPDGEAPEDGGEPSDAGKQLKNGGNGRLKTPVGHSGRALDARS